MRFTTAVLASASLAFAGAAAAAEPAEPPIANPDQIISSVTTESLADLLREMGAPQVEIREAGGQKVIVFSESGMPYNMQTAMCDLRPGKCIAFAVVALLETGTTTVSLDSINSANKGNIYLTMFKLDGSKIGAGNMQLIDGGVTKRNVAINIASFIVTFRQLLKNMQGQTIAGVQNNGIFGNGPFQQTSAVPMLRPVVATPHEMNVFINEASKNHATTFATRR
jgi:hypothetical protein